MQSHELGVLEHSYYYIHTASITAEKAFFYPICAGYFRYAPFYCLNRNSYNSFLIMYIKKGQCCICTENKTYTAKEGQIAVLDCYKPHSYSSNTGWEAQWLHLDGVMARTYFELLADYNSLIFILKDTYKFEKYMNLIYNMLKDGTKIKEALLSEYITILLTELLTGQEISVQHAKQADLIEDSIVYINEHLAEPLTLEQLSSNVSLSPFYFTRLFKKETGFTPYEYLIAARINMAKFLLKNTDNSIKEICFLTGFSNESSFCTTFKKRIGVTPSVYRFSI